jgi:flagellar biosynthesis/type III secretory pathway protein FliH
VTADDIARDLMVNGLGDAIEDALRSAAKQGEATIQGKCDEIIRRYDDECAEYKLAHEEGPRAGDPNNVKATRRYHSAMMTIVHELAAAVGSDEA